MTGEALGQEILNKTHRQRRRVEYFPNLNCLPLLLRITVGFIYLCSWRQIHEETSLVSNVIDHKNGQHKFGNFT